MEGTAGGKTRAGLLVYVDVQPVVGDEALAVLGAPHLDGQARAHLGPDQRHLGAQPKFAACLLQPILGAGQHAAQQVGNVLMRHPNAVVLQRYNIVSSKSALARNDGPWCT